MNRYEAIFIIIVFLALSFDIITYLTLPLTGISHVEANPFKVFFGESVLWIILPLSLLILVGLHFILTKVARNNLERGLVILTAANISYAKIIASITNLYVSSNASEYQEVVYTNEYLLFGYLITIIIILVSPIFFNLFFFWIYWNWFGKKQGAVK